MHGIDYNLAIRRIYIRCNKQAPPAYERTYANLPNAIIGRRLLASDSTHNQ